MSDDPKKGGFYIVVSAPSGAGKTSLCRALTAKYPALRFAISHTSRPPRAGEEDGKDYHFISAAEFRRKVATGDFVEWVEHYGNFYGTSRAAVNKAMLDNGGVIFDVEPRGAKSLQRFFAATASGLDGAKTGYAEGKADATGGGKRAARGAFVFIMPPSLAELAKRLRGRRSEEEKQLEKRLAQAQSEIAEAKWYDQIIINDDFDTALSELEALYLSLS